MIIIVTMVVIGVLGTLIYPSYPQALASVVCGILVGIVLCAVIHAPYQTTTVVYSQQPIAPMQNGAYVKISSENGSETLHVLEKTANGYEPDSYSSGNTPIRYISSSERAKVVEYKNTTKSKNLFFTLLFDPGYLLESAFQATSTYSYVVYVPQETVS